MITLQRDFSHFLSGALIMAIIANIPSRGIFHIYLPSGALMATADIPSRGIIRSPLWRPHDNVQLSLQKRDFFTFPLEV